MPTQSSDFGQSAATKYSSYHLTKFIDSFKELIETKLHFHIFTNLSLVFRFFSDFMENIVFENVII